MGRSDMERMNIRLTIEDRNLILDKTFAGDDLTERLRAAKVEENHVNVVFTLDEIDDLAGFIAAEANHTEDSKQASMLEALYDKISDIESKYL
jgi:hypothetical protein